MLRTLPLGRSDFAALRARNDIYVDKTALIYELAAFDAKVFLARPRRFGKSLLASAFASLFAEGVKYFQGLAIEKCWNDRTYPVARLDFSVLNGFQTADEFRSRFLENLVSAFSAIGFRFEKDSLGVMSQLSNWFSSLPPASIVILIDEYDAPLTYSLNDPGLFAQVRSIMSEFFLILKAKEGCQRFFFMTGITKFSSTSIFSAFNNLLDITLDPAYGTLLGYTEEEIHANFEPYIEHAAKVLNTTQDDILSKLKVNYDGFCFDEQASTHVYCPWSVLNFLKQPNRGYKNYWYQSGGQPTALMKYLANHALSAPKAYAQTKEVRLSDLESASQYDLLGIDVLLTQAGYYTIKSVTLDGFAILGYPNQEVALSMAQLYADELLAGKSRIIAPIPVADALCRGDEQAVLDYFNAAAHAIDYQHYPIHNEASVRAFMQVLLIGSALVPYVEVHNASGRSDLEAAAGDYWWVFEFKFARRSSEAARLLQQAENQMIERGYGMPPHQKKRKRVALVFDGEKKQFTAWKCLDASV